MIFDKGHLTPLKFQLDEAKRLADSSFRTVSSDLFLSHFPYVPGFENAEPGALLLKLRNVEPHNDPWVSQGSKPKARRALFWLLEGGQNADHAPLIFGSGRTFIKLQPGDFVVFNDAVDHWVMSEKQWRGAAMQLRPSKPKDSRA